MPDVEIGNKKQRHTYDGGMFEIEHYGRPSQLKIRDKRSQSNIAQHIREDMECILMEIDGMEKDIDKVDMYLDSLFSRIKQRIHHKKQENKNKKAKNNE